ncbi:MAG: hypothetical protein J7K08_07120 [Thermoplasmata archaeon]|nr:hypothetical protein [Thermoplasmata archaeon]
MSDKSKGEGAGPFPLYSLLSMVGVYFLIILLALFLSPLFLRSGFQAFGEEGAFEVRWAICYMVAFLLLSLLLLYIVRKRRKRPVKYVLILSLWLGLFYTFIPLYSAVLSSGQWEPLRVPEVAHSMYLSEEDVLLLTEEGPLEMRAHGGVVEIIRWPYVYPVEKGDEVVQIPVIYGCEESRAVYTPSDGRLRVYDPREGYSTLFHLTPEQLPVAAISTPPGMDTGGEGVTLIFFTYQEYDGRYYGFFDITPPGFFSWSLYGNLPHVVNLSGPLERSLSTAYFSGGEWFIEVYAGEDLFLLNGSSHTPLQVTKLKAGLSLEGCPTAIAHQGNITVLGTDKGRIYALERGIIKKKIRLAGEVKEIVPTRKFEGYSQSFLVLTARGSLTLLAGERDLEVVYPMNTLLQGLRGDIERVYLLGEKEDDLKEMVVVAVKGGEVFYSSPVTVTLGYYPQMFSLLSASILIVLLRSWPRWWTLDLVGVLAGAGLISIIGISLAPLPLVVLLLALAVYDAVAVYKTKHMLELAESAVESRMPVMLVFPKRRRFKMPKGLGFRKGEGRRREAFFMGLGDVVIPGTLVVSSYVYLPQNQMTAGVPFNLFASLLIITGLALAHAILIIVLLRGKPQAGLPYLNGGALAGLAAAYIIHLL